MKTLLTLMIVFSLFSCKKVDDCYRYDFKGRNVTMSDLFSNELSQDEIQIYIQYHRHILGDSVVVTFSGIEECPH